MAAAVAPTLAVEAVVAMRLSLEAAHVWAAARQWAQRAWVAATSRLVAQTSRQPQQRASADQASAELVSPAATGTAATGMADISVTAGSSRV
jgi:hypothetical protein